MALGDGNVLSTDAVTDKIYQHSGFSSTITDSFSTNRDSGHGVSYDGTYIASAVISGSDRGVVVFDGFSSTVKDSFNKATASQTPQGCTHDNTSFSIADTGLNKILKMSGYSYVISDSFSSPGSNPAGVDWDGSNILSVDFPGTGNEKFYKHSGFSSTISDSFTKVSATAPGWNGSDLLGIIGNGTDKILKFSGFSSTVKDSFSTPGSSPTGLHWDTRTASIDFVPQEGNVLSTDPVTEKIYKHSGYTSTISDSFSVASYGSPQGLGVDSDNNVLACKTNLIVKHSGFSSTVSDSFGFTPNSSNANRDVEWDGTDTIVINDGEDKIYKLSAFTATIKDSFSTPAARGMGVAWDGTNIISSDLNTKRTYKHSGFSSTITDSFIRSNSPLGTAWDGKNTLVSESATTDIIALFVGFSSVEHKSFTVPGTIPNDVAFLPDAAVVASGYSYGFIFG